MAGASVIAQRPAGPTAPTGRYGRLAHRLAERRAARMVRWTAARARTADAAPDLAARCAVWGLRLRLPAHLPDAVQADLAQLDPARLAAYRPLVEPHEALPQRRILLGSYPGRERLWLTLTLHLRGADPLELTPAEGRPAHDWRGRRWLWCAEAPQSGPGSAAAGPPPPAPPPLVPPEEALPDGAAETLALLDAGRFDEALARHGLRLGPRLRALLAGRGLELLSRRAPNEQQRERLFSAGATWRDRVDRALARLAPWRLAQVRGRQLLEPMAGIALVIDEGELEVEGRERRGQRIARHRWQRFDGHDAARFAIVPPARRRGTPRLPAASRRLRALLESGEPAQRTQGLELARALPSETLRPLLHGARILPAADERVGDRLAPGAPLSDLPARSAQVTLAALVAAAGGPLAEQLSRLRLSGPSPAEPLDVSPLAALPALRLLQLHRWAGLERPHPLPGLERLALSHLPQVPALAPWAPALQQLRLESLVRQQQPLALPGGLRQLTLTNLPRLERIALPDGLRQLQLLRCRRLAPALPQGLERLVCDSLPRTAPASLLYLELRSGTQAPRAEQLTRLPLLRALHAPISGSLAPLAALPLRELGLTGGAPMELAALHELSDLRHLAVSDLGPLDLRPLEGLPLTSLALRRLARTPLPRLERLPTLRSLELAGYPLRPRDLVVLAGLPALEELHLHGTQYAPALVSALAERSSRGLPAVRLRWG